MRVEGPDIPKIITAFNVGMKAMFSLHKDAAEKAIALLCGAGRRRAGFNEDRIIVEAKASGHRAGVITPRSCRWRPGS